MITAIATFPELVEELAPLWFCFPWSGGYVLVHKALPVCVRLHHPPETESWPAVLQAVAAQGEEAEPGWYYVIADWADGALVNVRLAPLH